MRKLTFLLLCLLLLESCSNHGHNKVEVPEESPEVDTQALSDTQLTSDTLPEAALWADSSIMNYLDHNSERLTEVDGYPISYMKYRATRKGRTYAKVGIGHSFELRYVTEQLIFIDSLTKDVYEYDVLQDSLIPWTSPNR